MPGTNLSILPMVTYLIFLTTLFIFQFYVRKTYILLKKKKGTHQYHECLHPYLKKKKKRRRNKPLNMNEPNL